MTCTNNEYFLNPVQKHEGYRNVCQCSLSYKIYTSRAKLCKQLHKSQLYGVQFSHLLFSGVTRTRRKPGEKVAFFVLSSAVLRP